LVEVPVEIRGDHVGRRILAHDPESISTPAPTTALTAEDPPVVAEFGLRVSRTRVLVG
jgi:hypothetical protein